MGIINDIKVLTGTKQDDASEKKPAYYGKTVLVVEDEKSLANILHDRLTQEGFKVIKASNGQEGLDAAIANHPSVVLLDLLMPVMDGKSMLIKLREKEEFKKTPVIVLTNAGEVENIKITQHYFNAVEFLIKSNVTLDQILERVKHFAW